MFLAAPFCVHCGGKRPEDSTAAAARRPHVESPLGFVEELTHKERRALKMRLEAKLVAASWQGFEWDTSAVKATAGGAWTQPGRQAQVMRTAHNKPNSNASTKAVGDDSTACLPSREEPLYIV